MTKCNMDAYHTHVCTLIHLSLVIKSVILIKNTVLMYVGLYSDGESMIDSYSEEIAS